MPSSSLRKPLPKTYRIEGALVEEHNQRMKRAMDTWRGQPICPDCYRPLEKHNGNVFGCSS